MAHKDTFVFFTAAPALRTAENWCSIYLQAGEGNRPEAKA